MYCAGKGEQEHACVSVHASMPVVGKEHVSDPGALPASSAGENFLIKPDSELPR